MIITALLQYGLKTLRFVDLHYTVISHTQQNDDDRPFQEGSMEVQEFEAEVGWKALPGLSLQAREQAVTYFVRHGRTRRSDINECLDLAYRFDLLLASTQPSTEGAAQHLTPITPGQLVVSARLTAAIKPRVEAVRLELFGATTAPFASYEAAVAWLEPLGAGFPALSSAEAQRKQKLEREILKNIGEWEHLTGRRWRSSRGFDYILYAKPGSQWQQVLPIPLGSRLVPLAQAIREISEMTGFSQPSVVAYILADIAPLLPSVHTHIDRRWSEKFQSYRIQVRIDFNSPDVTYDQFRRLYGEVRQAWNVAKEKRYTERDYQLLAIVESLGGEPRKGPAAFWRKAQQLWNDEEKRKTTPLTHKDWRITQNKYHRLLKRLPEAPASQRAVMQSLLPAIPEGGDSSAQRSKVKPDPNCIIMPPDKR